MTHSQQAETKTFTVRTGGRKLTYVFRPRKRFSNLLKFLIAIFGGQVILWPGIATAQVAANALPTGGAVQAGAATLGQAGNAMTVNQTSSKVIINYATFNIGKDASVTFNQPSASSVALNQVTGSTEASQILGRLSSNGQVWLQNAGGVYFGKSATVDVGGMLATSLKIDTNLFMNGNSITMEKNGSAGSVVNEGSITTKNGGYVALIAPQVSNTGVINAPMGTVRLAAGDKVTVDMAGDGLVNLNVDKAAADAIVANAGVISANGGTVVLSARSAGNLASLVVNNTGIIEARTLGERNGRILLDGGSSGIVENTGSLVATGDAAGAQGGRVQLAGEKVGVLGNGSIDVSGDAGGGTALVGGNYQGRETTSIIDGSAMQNAQVVAVGSKAVIRADAVRTGNGGKVILWSDDTTRFAGSISAQGGARGGDGGLVETSAHNSLQVTTSRVNTLAARGQAGQWLLDPGDLRVIDAAAGGGNDFAAFNAGPGAYTASKDPSRIADADVALALVTGNVVLTTDAAGAGTGKITFANGVLIDPGNVAAQTLTANAFGGIEFLGTASIVPVGGGSLGVTLNAGNGATLAGQITMSKNATISTNGGQLVMNARDDIVAGAITAAGGISLNSVAGAITQVGLLDSTGGVLTANAGKDINLGTSNNLIPTLGLITSAGGVSIKSATDMTLVGDAAGNGIVSNGNVLLAVAGTNKSLTVNANIFNQAANSGIDLRATRNVTVASTGGATGPLFVGGTASALLPAVAAAAVAPALGTAGQSAITVTSDSDGKGAGGGIVIGGGAQGVLFDSVGMDITFTGGAGKAVGVGKATAGAQFTNATILAGAGALTVQAQGAANAGAGVSLESRSLLATTSGAVSITGTAGNAGQAASGVQLLNSTIDSGTGVLSLVGVGGGDIALVGSMGSYGVLVSGVDASITTALAAGSSNITGVGGSSVQDNHGVRVETGARILLAGAGTLHITGLGGTNAADGFGAAGVSLVTATLLNRGGGLLDISGVGGQGGLGGNRGVDLLGGVIRGSASSTGNLLIVGTGGSGTTATTGLGNDGVMIDSTSVVTQRSTALASAAEGNISITGQAGTSMNAGPNLASGSSGVVVMGTVSSWNTTAAGGGNITISGSGSTGALAEHSRGVIFNGGEVRTKAATIGITGAGDAAATGQNVGVWLAGSIVSTDTGAISVHGTGGGAAAASATADGNVGVLVEGSHVTVTGDGGGISLVGVRGGKGSSWNSAVGLDGGTVVANNSSTSAGTVIISGTSGGANDLLDYNMGVYIFDSTVSANAGDLLISGMGSPGQGAGNIGLLVAAVVRPTRISTASAAAQAVIHGVGGAASGDYNYGVGFGKAAGGNDSTVTVDLAGKTMISGIGGGSGSNAFGVVVYNSAALTLHHSDSAIVGVGGGGGGADAGFNAGVLVNDKASVTFTNTTTVAGTSPTITGLGGGGTAGDNDGVRIGSADANGTIGGTITVTNGNLTIVGNGGAGALSDGVNILAWDTGTPDNNPTLQNSGGGILSVVGIGGTLAGASGHGINVDDLCQCAGNSVNTGARLINSGSGEFNLTGLGGGTGPGTSMGVVLQGANVSLTNTGEGGKLSITGTGSKQGAGGDSYMGVQINQASVLDMSPAGGGIRITGLGGGNELAGDSRGVFMNGATVGSLIGDISIKGTGVAGAGPSNFAVQLEGSTVTSGAGSIVIDGRSNAPGTRDVLLGGASQLTITDPAAGSQLVLIARSATGGVQLGTDTADVDTLVLAPHLIVASANGVTQYAGTLARAGADATTTGAELYLSGAGEFYLERTSNDFSTIAANISDNGATRARLLLGEANGFTIGTVNGCVTCAMATAPLTGVTVGASAGNLVNGTSVAVNGNQILFNVLAGDVTQAATANVVTSELVLLGGASYLLGNGATLANGGNDVDVVAASLGSAGALLLRDIDSLAVGRVAMNDADKASTSGRLGTYTTAGISTGGSVSLNTDTAGFASSADSSIEVLQGIAISGANAADAVILNANQHIALVGGAGILATGEAHRIVLNSDQDAATSLGGQISVGAGSEINSHGGLVALVGGNATSALAGLTTAAAAIAGGSAQGLGAAAGSSGEVIAADLVQAPFMSTPSMSAGVMIDGRVVSGAGDLVAKGQAETHVIGAWGVAVDGTAGGANGVVSSSDGHITLMGSSGGGLSEPVSAGVAIDNHARVEASGAGNIAITGATTLIPRGAGVLVSRASTVSVNTGNLVISGTSAGTGGYPSAAVLIAGDDTSIQSGAGDIGITGINALVGGVNLGVIIGDGADLTAGGNSHVTIVGKAGQNDSPPNDSGNVGVLIGWAGNGGNTRDTRLSVANGQLDITGHGGSGLMNNGVMIGKLDPAAAQGATITSTGGAAITVTGQAGGGAPGAQNMGVAVRGALIQSTSADAGGAVSIVGSGGADGTDNNHGVYVVASSVTSQSGNISMTGAGAGTGSSNAGVFIDGSTVSAANAARISLTGTGSAAAADNNAGIYLYGHDASAVIIKAATGAIDMTGFGGGGSGAGGDSNRGIRIYANGSQAIVIADGGSISLTGSAGGTGAQAHGVSLEQSGAEARVVTNGAGAVTISGTASGSSGIGVLLAQGTAVYSDTGEGLASGTIVLKGQGSGAEGVKAGADTVIGAISSAGLVNTVRGNTADILVQSLGGTGISLAGRLETNDKSSINLSALGGGNVSDAGGAGQVIAGHLRLTNDGAASSTFTLANAGNDVDNLVASIGGANSTLSYVDRDGLRIDTLAQSDFALSTGGKLSIAAVNGVTVQDAAATASNRVTFTSGAAATGQDAVVQTAAGVIATGALELLGAGPYVLTGANNAITTLAASTSEGGVALRAGNGYTVGTAGGTAGISTSSTLGAADVVLLGGAGDIVIAQNITARGGDVLLQAGGGNVNLIAALDAPAGNVTVVATGSVAMGVINGQGVNITAGQDITDANGAAGNITATVQTTLTARTGTITTTPTPGLAPLYQGIVTPTLTAYAGGVTSTALGDNISIDVWGQVGNDTVVVPQAPPGEVYLNGRRLGGNNGGSAGAVTGGAIAGVGFPAAAQTWPSSTGEIMLMDPLNTGDQYAEAAFGTASARVNFENTPAPALGLDAADVHINNGGIRLPVGVSLTPGIASMILAPGGAPMNLPNGTLVAMAANGDVVITLPTAAAPGAAGGLSAVIITPAGIIVGRNANGLPMGVDGGIAGNATLRGLLEQIAGFLPEEYRRRWGVGNRTAGAGAGTKVSQL